MFLRPGVIGFHFLTLIDLNFQGVEQGLDSIYLEIVPGTYFDTDSINVVLDKAYIIIQD